MCVTSITTHLCCKGKTLPHPGSSTLGLCYSFIWDPFTVKNISSIQKVQRQAARFVTSTYGRDTSVTKLLNQLHWNTQVRREAHRLICFYKMIDNQLDIDYQSHIETKPDRRRRGHSNQFVIPAANTDVYTNSYFPRTLRTWNNLQQTTIDQTSPHSFKAAVIQELSKPKILTSTLPHLQLKLFDGVFWRNTNHVPSRNLAIKELGSGWRTRLWPVVYICLGE